MDLKVLLLILYWYENKLDLLFSHVPKGFWRTPDILPATETVNHLFIIFAFSLYNMPFFTHPYICSYKDIHLPFTQTDHVFGSVTTGHLQCLPPSGVKCQNGTANRGIFLSKCEFVNISAYPLHLIS